MLSTLKSHPSHALRFLRFKTKARRKVHTSRPTPQCCQRRQISSIASTGDPCQMVVCVLNRQGEFSATTASAERATWRGASSFSFPTIDQREAREDVMAAPEGSSYHIWTVDFWLPSVETSIQCMQVQSLESDITQRCCQNAGGHPW